MKAPAVVPLHLRPAAGIPPKPGGMVDARGMPAAGVQSVEMAALAHPAMPVPLGAGAGRVLSLTSGV